jgi:hypothetical protein
MIGGLANYVKGYTNCLDQCDFDKSDKTQRLGFDNTSCLLKCNTYYNYLERHRLPDKSFYPDVIPKQCLTQPTLQAQGKCYQFSYCLKQCELDKNLMTQDNMKRCVDRCRRLNSI